MSKSHPIKIKILCNLLHKIALIYTNNYSIQNFISYLIQIS